MRWNGIYFYFRYQVSLMNVIKYVSWKCITSGTTSFTNTIYRYPSHYYILPLIPPLTYNYHLTQISEQLPVQLLPLPLSFTTSRYWTVLRLVVDIFTLTTPSQLRTFFMDDTFHQSHYIEVAQEGIFSRAIHYWLWIFNLFKIYN